MIAAFQQDIQKLEDEIRLPKQPKFDPNTPSDMEQGCGEPVSDSSNGDGDGNDGKGSCEAPKPRTPPGPRNPKIPPRVVVVPVETVPEGEQTQRLSRSHHRDRHFPGRRHLRPPQGSKRLLHHDRERLFAHFRSTGSKTASTSSDSTAPVTSPTTHISDAAFADTARHGVARITIDRSRGHSQKHFDSKEQWLAPLEALCITGAELIKRSSEVAL